MMKLRNGLLAVTVATTLFAVACASDSGTNTPPSGDDRDEIETIADPDPDTGGDREETPGDRDEAPPRDGCLSDEECRSGQACNRETFKCEAKACTDDSECTDTADAQRACGKASEGIGAGICYAKLCRAAADCKAGFACKGGQCKKQEAGADTVDRIELVASGSAVRQGQKVTLTAVAYAASGAIIDSDASKFTFESDAADKVAVDAAGAATGGTASGTANVKAKRGGKESSAVALRNFANVAQGTVRVVVYDIASRAFIKSSTEAKAIVLVNGVTAELGQDDATAGVAEATGVTGTGRDIHVFVKGYKWFSAFGLQGDDFVVPLEKQPEAVSGGVKGVVDFSPIPAGLRGDIQLAIGGLAIKGNLLDISFSSLLGDSINRQIKIPNVIDQAVALPGGIQGKLADNVLSPEFFGFSPAGNSRVWAIGGYLPFSEVVQIVVDNLPASGTGDLSELNIGAIASQLLPFLRNFYHSISKQYAIQTFPKIPDTADIDGDGDKAELVFDGSKFQPTGSDVKLSQQQNQKATLKFTNFNLFGANAQGTGAITLAATNVSGIGILPLGLTIALDQNADGQTDGKLDDTELPYAPTHSGVEGSPYYFLSLAASINEIIGGDSGIKLSGLIKRYAAGAAPDATITFQDYPGFPTFDGSDWKTGKVKLNAAATGAAAQVHRAVLSGEKNDWIVYVKGGTLYELPTPPTGFTKADVINDKVSAQVNAIALVNKAGGTTPISYDELLGFNDTNLDSLNTLTNGFVLWLP